MGWTERRTARLLPARPARQDARVSGASDQLRAFVQRYRVVVLTGAGLSTDSGIPDYRGPTAPKRARPPMQLREFLGSREARARYWARSMLGWPRIRAAQPNAAHHALVALEQGGRVAGLITQNVDRLHHRAGSLDVVELHGALAEVRCLECGDLSSRDELQARLVEANPRWLEHEATPLHADGDAELDVVHDFHVVSCLACGGTLKPHVVFFGENVPKPVTDAAWATFERGEALVVLGSSLTVFSGYRFVRRAAERGLPVAIVNQGPTRGDAEATLRVDARLAEVLPALL